MIFIQHLSQIYLLHLSITTYLTRPVLLYFRFASNKYIIQPYTNCHISLPISTPGSIKYFFSFFFFFLLLSYPRLTCPYYIYIYTYIHTYLTHYKDSIPSIPICIIISHIHIISNQSHRIASHDTNLRYCPSIFLKRFDLHCSMVSVYSFDLYSRYREYLIRCSGCSACSRCSRWYP